MPLRVSLGSSKKLGLPGYSSVGASCNLELELEATLLESDPQRFQQQVQRAYLACAEAIDTELRRQQTVQAEAEPDVLAAPSSRPTNGHAARGQRSHYSERSATAAQIRALEAIADREGLDLIHLLRERCDLDDPAQLSVRAASELISCLQTAAHEGGRQ